MQTLRQFEDLARTPAAVLEKILHAGLVEDLPAGRLLFKPGVREQQTLYLVSGEVALVSDNKAVGNVIAGSAAARRPLAPERPRRLWGWTRSKVQVISFDSQLLAQLTAAEGEGPAAAVVDSVREQALDQQLHELRAALQDAERQRTEAQQQLQAARSQITELLAELDASRTRLQDACAEPAGSGAGQPMAQSRSSAEPRSAEPRPADPAPAHPRGPAAEVDMDAPLDIIPADVDALMNATRALPSLRLDPKERAALAPGEVDDLLDLAPMEVPQDWRCRGHQR